MRIAFNHPSYNNRYLLTHPWRLVEWLYNETRWFAQRGWRGYSDVDLYDMMSYNTAVVLPMLRWLRDNSHTFPGKINGVATYEEWQALIDQMIDGFEAARMIQEDDYVWTPEHCEELQERFRRGAAVFVKHYFSLWD